MQFASSPYKGPIDCLMRTVREKGFSALYRGLSAQIIGTACKAGIRFFSFEEFKKALRDKDGQLSGQRLMLGNPQMFLFV
jgi:solute carrier family 25 (mitochondrial citrate transporter), member 1